MEERLMTRSTEPQTSWGLRTDKVNPLWQPLLPPYQPENRAQSDHIPRNTAHPASPAISKVLCPSALES